MSKYPTGDTGFNVFQAKEGEVGGGDAPRPKEMSSRCTSRTVCGPVSSRERRGERRTRPGATCLVTRVNPLVSGEINAFYLSVTFPGLRVLSPSLKRLGIRKFSVGNAETFHIS